MKKFGTLALVLATLSLGACDDNPTGAEAGSMSLLLTDAPGSSAYRLLDTVVYANSAKRAVLSVPAETLEAYGAVSGETAAAMAEGVLAKAGADLAVAITGVAGPDGGSAQRPVGTVWFALAARGQKTRTVHRLFQGDRDRVRLLSAYFALQLVAEAEATWPNAEPRRGDLV